MFYMGFFILKNELFAHSLIFGERCERIAQVAHQKWAMWANRSGWSPNMSVHERFSQVAHQKWVTMSESRRLLTNNEQMSELLVFLSKTIIRSFFRKNERFAQKTDEQIPSPEPEPPRASNLFVWGRSQIFLIWAFYSPQVLRHTLKFILASGADQR